MKVNFIKLSEDAQKPYHGSKEAAGYDLYNKLDTYYDINPGQTVVIGTGIAAAIPEKTFGAVFPRSGLATKKGLRLANSVGVIDSDYRGEIKVALYNDSDITQTVTAGERIAQLVIIPYIRADFEQVTELDETDRGEGGFGSSGTN